MSLFDQLRRSILGNNEQTLPKTAEAQTPKVPVPAPEEQHAERRRRRRVDARKGTRVLIIDDSPTIVAALKKILHSAKYVTHEAFDAETGLQIAQTEQPELIFLDIVLPGMNGFAALRLMRRDPKTQHIPIIMISGNEQATEQFYANRIGADDFMKKPFSRFEVFARIEGLLDSNHIPRRKGSTETNATSAPSKPDTHEPSPAVPPAALSQAVTAPVSRPVNNAQPVPASQPAPSASGVSVNIPPPNLAQPVPRPTAPSYVQSVTLQPTVARPAYTPPVVNVTAPKTATVPQPSSAYAVPVPPVVVTHAPAPAPHAAPAMPPRPAPATATAGLAVHQAASTAVPSSPSFLSSPLEARKELTAMGLQYFDQEQFFATIKRGDKLAFELFVAGGGIDIAAELNGKTPLQFARENGRTQIFAILRSKLAALNS